MMREFLEAYDRAIDLDGEQYNCHFPSNIKRSDFFLFNKQIVCECKEFQSIEIRSKVEEISRENNLLKGKSEDVLYKRIEKSLRYANKQISDTKKVLNCPEAFGLVILENLIPNDLSVLSLIRTAEREMIGGLADVDCVLCLDLINTFSNSEGRMIGIAQTVSRDPEKEKRLYELLNELMMNFCDRANFPLLKEFEIEKAEEIWSTNENGKYNKYEAKLNFKTPAIEVELNWRQKITQFLDKWWWVIPLPAIFYDWFIH